MNVSIAEAIADPLLLGAALGDLSSWCVWQTVFKAAYAIPLTEEEAAIFAKISGDRKPPTRKVKQLVIIVSRRGGKGRSTGALVTYETALVDHSAHLAPGETGIVACISPTREQAKIVRNYALGYFETSPVLRNEIEDTTNDEIRLKNGHVIATLANDYRTLRGRTLLMAVLDEAAFLRDETSANPDIEAARALLPGLNTTGGMLVVLSSPYRRAGLLYQRHRDYFGKDSDEVLVVQGPSILFNPTLDIAQIEADREADPQAAASEWDGLFRTDLAAFLDDAMIDGAIERGRPVELPPRDGFQYHCFVDASAGRHDRFTCCIGHREGDRIVADVIRGRHPPFDPNAVAAEYAALAKEYHCGSVCGDNYAGEWVVQAFKSAGIDYRRAEHPKSVLYLEGLPAFTRGNISIPEHEGLVRELRLLERRVARSGRDSVDHGPAGTDDYSNSLFGMIWLCRERLNVIPEIGVVHIPAPDGDRPWLGISYTGGSGFGFPW